MKMPPALPSQCICRQSKSCNFTCQICTADLQANIKIVGDAHNILMLHGVVGQTLHSLMVQKGHQQLLSTLHLYSCSEGALACIKPIEHTLRLQKCAHKLVMHWAKHYLASALKGCCAVSLACNSAVCTKHALGTIKLTELLLRKLPFALLSVRPSYQTWIRVPVSRQQHS